MHLSKRLIFLSIITWWMIMHHSPQPKYQVITGLQYLHTYTGSYGKRLHESALTLSPPFLGYCLSYMSLNTIPDSCMECWLHDWIIRTLKMQLVSLQVPTTWTSDTETVYLGDKKSFARLKLSVSCRLKVPQICIILTGTHFCLKPYCLKPQFSPDNHGIKTDTKSTCGWQMIQ